MSDRRSGKVRIIGGQYKRTPVDVMDVAGLRPTGDRQRETIFNWLAFLLGSFDGKKSLDMFAGTGVLSLEFMSRGGSEAIAFEKNRVVASKIRAMAEKLQTNVRVFSEDCLKSKHLEEYAPYDVAFIDPPFSLNLQLKALTACIPCLSQEGLVYIESPEEIRDDMLSQMDMIAVRRGKGGASFLLLAQKRRKSG